MEEMFYLCIDLKSFYASVEAVERGLDPFKTNLVVADPSRSEGAICLAISPAMKDLGIPNRCRVFEIPKGLDYITAMPRMKLYMRYSADIYSVYLRFISKEDIHVYSIDECFFDITHYIKMYNKSPKEIAVMIIDEVYRETGICATAGIGTNMFLAKLALDITAKHSEDHIGFLDENEFKKNLWFHRPITDIWGIGRGIAKRLEHFGIFDLYGVAHTEEKLLYKEFGVNAEILIDHSKGIEPCTIADIKAFKPTTTSLSNSQVLFSDYEIEDAGLILKEMAELMSLELVDNGLVTNSISLGITYSDRNLKSSGATRKLGEHTSSTRKLEKYFLDLYYEIVNRTALVRKISISVNRLVPADFVNLDFFSEYITDEKERKRQQAIVDIRKKYGKNSVIKGMNLKNKATTLKRNKMVGGHNGG